MNSAVEINKRISGLIILGVSVFCTCKKHYSPPATTHDYNYLVVEGVIAAGQDSTIIKLSRTVTLSSQTVNSPEVNAQVSVESDQNVSYTLAPIDSGRYAAASLSLDNTHKYRLHITTSDGKVYESEYEPVKVTPAIDTLQYQITADGLDLLTNTHDPADATRYYRWDYTETYIYLSDIESNYVYDPGRPDSISVVLRRPDQQIHTCYITSNSSAIIINSSAALSHDVIQNNPITQIVKNSEKIAHRYSIVVRQYALSQNAYEFWTILKRNTQQIGTIFDVQPSEVKGNIHCVSDPSVPVLGYISVSTVSKKRIFISRNDLPAWPYPAPVCDVKTLKPTPLCWFKTAASPPDELKTGIFIPIDTVGWNGNCDREHAPEYTVPTVYYTCADCRYHLKGKTQKPAFWIDQ